MRSYKPHLAVIAGTWRVQSGPHVQHWMTERAQGFVTMLNYIQGRKWP